MSEFRIVNKVINQSCCAEFMRTRAVPIRSVCPFRTCSIWSGMIEFSRTAHPTEFTVDTALSNTPTKGEIDQMNAL